MPEVKFNGFLADDISYRLCPSNEARESEHWKVKNDHQNRTLKNGFHVEVKMCLQENNPDYCKEPAKIDWFLEQLFFTVLGMVSPYLLH